VFPYSPRPGTPAAHMPQLDPLLVKERAARLRAAGAAALKSELSARIGRDSDVLIEAPGRGRADCYAAVRFDGVLDPGTVTRMRTGLSRSSTRLNEGINTIFLRRRLDSVALAELEDLLIASDMGTGVAGEVVEALRRTRFDQEIAPDEVRAALADEVIRLVEPVQKPLRIDPARRPFVILVVGVNGSGKTTTIGKLAKQYRDAGRSVMLAAGDTFRAAAVEQLPIWRERADAPVMM